MVPFSISSSSITQAYAILNRSADEDRESKKQNGLATILSHEIHYSSNPLQLSFTSMLAGEQPIVRLCGAQRAWVSGLYESEGVSCTPAQRPVTRRK